MTLDKLRCRRAADMIAMLDDQPRAALHDIPRTELRGCSARELEWLASEVTLLQGQVVRSATAPHATIGIASPFLPSVLIVTYTARYHLSDGAPDATRDVHVTYGALQATLLPTARGIGDL